MKYVNIFFPVKPFTDQLIDGIHLQSIKLEIPDEYDQETFNAEWIQMVKAWAEGTNNIPRVREK